MGEAGGENKENRWKRNREENEDMGVRLISFSRITSERAGYNLERRNRCVSQLNRARRLTFKN
jgi:hypothetical protein